MASVVVRPSFWSQAKKIPARYPMAFGVVLSGFKTSFSDLLVQKVVERREKIDWRRNSAFAAFGFIYLGGVQYTLYVPIFGRLFPSASQFIAKPLAKLKDTRGMFEVVAQTFLDQCVHHPLMYFPAFYITRELVMQDQPDVMKVLRQYKMNLTEDLMALWKIWVPCTLVNFAFMPMHFRIPFVAGVSLCWTCVLSAMRGGDVAHSDEMAGGAVTGASYLLLQEGLDVFNKTPVELDDTMRHVNISAAGKDRPGLVADLSRHIAREGGNVTHSKMIRLGEEFIIQMHVSIPPEKCNGFLKSLKKRDFTRELNIQTTTLTKRCSSKDAVFGMAFIVWEQTKPGMVALVAEKTASKGMTIDSLSTNLRIGRDGKREFVIDAMVSSPNMADRSNLDEIVNDISTLKTDLDLTHFDVFVEAGSMSRRSTLI
eukprot:CAMPEP_0176001638 /NCGR_PEP_ID=MMETSP0120_2-20121206/230_1 /TAXON_ID=160619 /ORGANISM="Kryptoperidinium foliaceum, Strain CCMP 1326" /LENGTH=425 /DNA_ID=CAMNT_0017334193 /DNA_START=73 /DNA_END=1351 /DNA_ORIENTATION=-